MDEVEYFGLAEFVVELDAANYAEPSVDAIHMLGKEMIANGITDVAKKLRALKAAFAIKPD